MIYLFLNMRDRFLCRRRSLSLALISLDRQLPLILSGIDFFQNSELRMPNLPLGKVDSRRASAQLVGPSRLKFFVVGVPTGVLLAGGLRKRDGAQLTAHAVAPSASR